MKNTLTILLLTAICLPACPALLFSQPGKNTMAAQAYVEKPDHPYRYIPREGRATSLPYRLTAPSFTIRQVNVDDAGDNILGDAANEPSLTLDPTNPLRMAIGWRQFDTISNNFRQAGYAYSLDGGENWTFPGPIQPGVFRSDPVLDSDSKGNLYYNSLSTDFSCQVFKSNAGETTWDAGIQAQGGDKQWMVIDKTGGLGNGHFYAFWKAGISVCPGSFTRSVDISQGFEECSTLPDDPTRGTLAIGPDGELYACGGAGAGFVVLKSTNAHLAGEPVTWDFANYVDMGGEIALYEGPNPSGMLGQVWIDVDRSGGPAHGYVYLLATVTSSTTGDRADIVFSRSTDGGISWSQPLILNDDASLGNYQWFGSLAVAPNGRIDATWYDTRDNPGSFHSRLYYSYSLDGGLTWSPDEALSEAFDPHLGWPQQQKIGDYNHMLSDEEGAHLAWAATFNGEEDVFYSYIKPNVEASAAHEAWSAPANFTQNYPNPFAEQTRLGFLLRRAGHVSLEVLDVFGKTVAVLKNERLPSGNYTAEWDARGIQNGMYWCRLRFDGQVVATKRLIRGGKG